VPDAPEENDQQDSLQVPPEESDTRYEQKKRRENEAPFKAFEQSPITIGAYHARQVMPHRTESRDKEKDVLRTPLGLS